MRLKALLLKNFRSYKDEVRIECGNMTAFIGTNDIGKSTVLEALEIFFNNSSVKIEREDPCVYSDSKEVTIGCIFDDLPEKVVLDATACTSLKDEYLLNKEGYLEIHKVFDCSLRTPKETVYVIAHHPTTENINDLLSLSNIELKKRHQSLGIHDDSVHYSSNVSIRQSIWNNSGELNPATVKIDLRKGDGRTIWENLSKEMPTYALFRADRQSTDDDAEVQDPMKLAVVEAIKSVEHQLEEIKETVRESAIDVAYRTLEKIREMDAELASELMPNFRAEPKWEGLFRLSLTGDDQIPINKRGSGVRRLVLLNFFRAEAERKQKESGSKGIIYAIEEPETSQHPTNQRLIVESLIELSDMDKSQVILTTHIPGLAGLLPLESLRFIEKDRDGKKVISCGDDDTYEKIAQALGVIPDSRVKAFICVEGCNDISFLKNMSSMIHKHHPEIPDLNAEERIAFIPLGGSTLKDWVAKHYLRGLNRPEIHIYDKDEIFPPRYQDECIEVNSRDDDSVAFLTTKREMENYLHPDAVREEFGIEVVFEDNDDVPSLVAEAVHESSSSGIPWKNLSVEKRKKKEGTAKRRLNNDAVRRMTIDRLNAIDCKGEVMSWLNAIADVISC